MMALWDIPHPFRDKCSRPSFRCLGTTTTMEGLLEAKQHRLRFELLRGKEVTTFAGKAASLRRLVHPRRGRIEAHAADKPWSRAHKLT